MVSVSEAAMDNLILVLAAWIPVAGFVLALCMYPDADCAGEQGHKEPVRSFPGLVFKPVAVIGEDPAQRR
jgi:hypothetical protein